MPASASSRPLEQQQVGKVLDLARRLRPGLTPRTSATRTTFPELDDRGLAVRGRSAHGHADGPRRAPRAAARQGASAMKPKKGSGAPSRSPARDEGRAREASRRGARSRRRAPAAPEARGVRRPRRPGARGRERSSCTALRGRHAPRSLARERVSGKPVERSPAAEKVAARGRRGGAPGGTSRTRAPARAVEDRARFEVSDDGSRVEGRRDRPAHRGAAQAAARRVPVDARIDLHGMSLGEARPHLDLFVRTMRARGERCVLVIHGKGKHSPGGVGVLRGEIAAWLSQGPVERARRRLRDRPRRGRWRGRHVRLLRK